MNGVRERTRQQLDPAGVLGMRPVTIAAAVAAVVFAALMTWVGPGHSASSWLSVLAVLLLAAASVVVIVQSSPLRAPLTARTHALIQVLALAGATTAIGASWGVNRYIYDDWPTVSLGILFLALASYRPSKELVSIGVLVAIYLGFLIMLEGRGFEGNAPSVGFVVASVTPMLAMCLGSAMFSSSILTSLDRWHRKAEVAAKKVTKQMRPGIVRSVQQDRVTILNKEVLPFFAEVLERGDVTAGDSARAAAISDSIRSLMVAESDRSWLEQVVEHAMHSRGVYISDFVTDPQRLAPMITTDQRTAIRALLVALFDEPEFQHRSLHFAFDRVGRRCRGSLIAATEGSDFAIRTALAPYLAVMRIVFSELHVDVSQSRLEIRMMYEQQR